jgi:hypothetical protein
MTAHYKLDLEAMPAPTNAQLMACDAVLECASALSTESAALIAAAANADLAATEARLWTCRRALTMAVTSWREAVPALPSDHNGNNK